VQYAGKHGAEKLWESLIPLQKDVKQLYNSLRP